MSDDLTRLRATMSDLAEHGGNSDLYQRALDSSRRLGRRRAAVSTAAAAVAVLAIATPIAFAQRHEPTPLPAADTPAATSPSPTTGPSATPKPSSVPQASSPSPSHGNALSPSHGTSPSHPTNGCPVTASTLQKVSGLEAGYKINASSIECKQNWATAAVTAPSVEMQGDGLIFFRYSPASGKWMKKGEGSDVPCGGDMGIPESTGFCNPDA
ncbi:hypothetical protein [Actinoplanes subglobosus]|uniref:Uncharacterized protein n=1 Tax=Actinoplanes subglobosus TaxID=1547892 RepID=A0ABV8IHD9_9ACTN